MGSVEMYTLSRDYKKLFELICKGFKAVGFVDYSFRDGSEPCRDICKIERRIPYEIYMGARGISYGTVYPFMEKDGSEEDVFISSCKSCNLEWIVPTESAASAQQLSE